jgi:hypothetical protein
VAHIVDADVDAVDVAVDAAAEDAAVDADVECSCHDLTWVEKNMNHHS